MKPMLQTQSFLDFLSSSSLRLKLNLQNKQLTFLLFPALVHQSIIMNLLSFPTLISELSFRAHTFPPKIGKWEFFVCGWGGGPSYNFVAANFLSG